MTEAAFLAIYRFRVAESAESDFIAHWEAVTQELAALGGQGSCLTRAEDGLFVAIARWPSEAARADAFARAQTRAPVAGVERLGDERLSVVSNLWR